MTKQLAILWVFCFGIYYGYELNKTIARMKEWEHRGWTIFFVSVTLIIGLLSAWVFTHEFLDKYFN